MTRAVFGTDEPPANSRRIVVGRLSFDFAAGAVRDVRVDGVELLRGIAFLVRDPIWATLAATLAATVNDVVVDEADGRAWLSWRARVDGFAWTAQIEAEADGLLFRAEGAATADLSVNRVGFVVLHPIDGFAGTAVEIEHTDGTRATVYMPHAVSPHQPASDVAALTHTIAGLVVRVAMAGDAFEMEDQRNWTDASFKTYVRPLSRPRPFILRAGEAVSQSVRLTVSGVATQPVAAVRGSVGTMPEIALTADAADALSLRAALDLLRPQWLHLRLDAADAPGPTIERREALLLDLRVASTSDLAAFAGLTPDAVALASETDMPGLLDVARTTFPNAAVGVGVRSHFTELNRRRPPPDATVLVHATSAIVHAADDRTVIESLEALHSVFASARALAPAAAYRPGPCTIGDPVGPAANLHGGRVPATRRDPRHGASFAAAWAVGVLAAAARGGVASISFGTPSGDFSLLADGRPTPLGHLVRAAAALAGRAVTVGTDRIEGDGFVLRANLTDAPVTLEAGMAVLGPVGWVAPTGGVLGPYGVARSAPWLQ